MIYTCRCGVNDERATNCTGNAQGDRQVDPREQQTGDEDQEQQRK